MFPPWRRRSNNGRRKGEGKWRREEERATAVPNREGKLKSRWTVASLPWYTKRCPGLHRRPLRNCTKGLAVVSLTCWNGTTCQRNIVCNFLCKMRSGRVGPRCRIISRLYCFNGVPFSFEARLTGIVCRENINYSTTTPPLVLVV